jgi:hypothetical protein
VSCVELTEVDATEESIQRICIPGTKPNPPTTRVWVVPASIKNGLIDVRTGKTFTVRLTDWVRPAESCTFAVKLEIPAAAGVPEIRPDNAVKVRPDGSEPAEIEYV